MNEERISQANQFLVQEPCRLTRSESSKEDNMDGQVSRRFELPGLARTRSSVRRIL